MKHRNSHLLVGYWSRLRRGREVPDQVDIDPRAIKRMLSNIFILEATNPQRPQYRLAGTSLCDRFGFELKGTDFLANWEASSRSALSLLLKQAQAIRQPVAISALGTTAQGAVVEMEIVLAPITFGMETPTRFLGIVQVLSDMAPLFGQPIAFQRLVASHFVREDTPLSTYVPPPPPPPAPPVLRSHPKAPHLRLVVSRERGMPANFDMDALMLELLEKLEIVSQPPLTLVQSNEQPQSA
jgi:hypothetical protein